MRNLGVVIATINRDSSIDFLRFIGLCMVTIVHVNAPYSVQLLAYCGVPLMVFVSGLCVNTSKVQFSWHVLLHRLKRLLVPLWFFLTIYWLVFYRIVNPKFYEVVQTFAMLGVAPYVWIIRVFIILACLTPVLVKMLRIYNQRIVGGYSPLSLLSCKKYYAIYMPTAQFFIIH